QIANCKLQIERSGDLAEARKTQLQLPSNGANARWRSGGLLCSCNLQFAICNLQFAILLLLCGLLFFYRLGDRDLWSSHEARAAQDAQCVVDVGRLTVPRLFDRHIELQKPPVYYWCVAALARLQGTA